MTKWVPSGTWVSNTITLDSVANNAAALSTTDITNGSSLELFADVSLILGSINPSGAPAVELHLRALTHNGTNFADVVTGAPTLVGASPVTTGSSIKYVLWGGPNRIVIPPGTFRWGIVNRTGVTFAGSGNALQHRLYSLG